MYDGLICNTRSIKIELFAVPNGGQRNVVVASKLKAEGVRAGVADLILMCGLGSSYIYRNENQKRHTNKIPEKHLKKMCIENGYIYEIARSFEDFKKLIEIYFQ